MLLMIVANSPPLFVLCSLSYAEMRLILARVIYNFDMELVDPEFEWFDQKAFLLYAKHPLQVYLTPVKR